MSRENVKGTTAKAIILDGSRADDREARIAADSLRKELQRSDVRFSHHLLRDIEIAPCVGCLKCWTKTPGECVIDDGQRYICSDMARSDCLILITPITFGGYSNQLKKGMDRLIPLLLPFFSKYQGETHHPARYGRGWDLLGLGTISARDEEKETLFKEIVHRNSLNMHSQNSSSLILVNGSGEAEIDGKVVAGLKQVIA